MSGMWLSASLAGMEEHADRSWARATVVIVSTWLWLYGGRRVCVRGGGGCIGDE